MGKEGEKRNNHYSLQTGHELRGEHEIIFRKLGISPECIPGYSGIEIHRKRRSMRRIVSSGKN